MKILIIHYRYHPLSGPERYLFNVMDLLTRNGHTIIPFSINYTNNVPSEFGKYFVEPIGDKNTHSFSAQKKLSVLDKIKIVKSSFYHVEAKKKLDELIKNEKPDVAYVLQFFGKLSISIFDACYENNIPVLLRLSDYGLICSKNIFYRNGQICTKCISNQFNGFKNRCVHESTSKSLLNYLALQYIYYKNFQSKIFCIITPSLTMKRLFGEANYFKKNTIAHVPTFYLSKDLDNLENQKNVQHTFNIDFCYLGRIADDKGVDVIIKAASILREKELFPKISIAGDFNNPFAQKLIRLCKTSNIINIEFTGLLNKERLLQLLSSSKFSIIPSMWFDNMPNSLIESQAVGVPVIASNLGSLPELISENYNGFLFSPGDANDLAQKMEQSLSLSHNQLFEYKTNSQKWAREYCSEIGHYNTLINLFERSINEKNN